MLSSDEGLQTSPVVESTASGTVLIGSSRERVGFDRSVSLLVLAQLAANAIALFPALASVKVMRSYLGFRPYCPDHLPVIGHDPRAPGLWHASGHEGAGIGLSVGTAKLLTQALAGQPTDLDLTAFRPDRFDNRNRPAAVGMNADDDAITFDGQRVPLRPGQSVGAALVSAGIRSWRTTRKDGRPRGLFCGIGICYDCLITVDSAPNQRACLTPARPGCRCAATWTPWPHAASRRTGVLSTTPRRSTSPWSARVRPGWPPRPPPPRPGSAWCVIDANTQPGGQYWRHGDETATDAAPTGQPDQKTYTRLRQRFDAARDTGRLQYLPNTQVWFVETPAAEQRVIRPSCCGRPDSATSGRSPRSPGWSGPPRLILCPGGYDRQLPVPGWDLPGVMAAGGVQAMLKGYGTLSGRRAVVAGTGPFLLPVAAGLAAAGAEVVGICEAAAVTSWLPQLGGAVQVPSKGLEAAGYAARARPAPDTVLDPVRGDHDQRCRSGPQRHHHQDRPRRAREARHRAGRSRSTWSRWVGGSRPPWSW